MKRIKYPEGDSVEFKECSGKKIATLPDDLWQSIAAFANSRGGSIYLGVKDDGEIVGFANNEIDKLQKDLSIVIKNKFNITPKADILCGDGYIEVIISEAEIYNKPIYSKKVGPHKIYIRQGSTNILASDEIMRSMFAGAIGGGENQIINDSPLDIIDENKVDKYITATGLKTIRFANLEEKLKKIKAVKDGNLTIFGLIAFGRDTAIDELSNNIYIDFKIFPGNSKVKPANLRKIYLERKEFRGDVFKQFVEAFDYIKTKLPKKASINNRTGLREEQQILPDEALREALANAIAHRDYLIQSSCINIDLYADRIELSNPGESLVAVNDLWKTSSKARNPNLMTFLKTCGVTDKTARGIPTIYQAAKDRGLLDPKFENISGDFKATLYFSSPHSNHDKVWVEELGKKYGLKDTQKNALVYARNNGSISNNQYCKLNHMNMRNDDRKARREIQVLVEKGLLNIEGKGPGTKYKIFESAE